MGIVVFPDPERRLQVDKREGLGCRNGVATGDRCRGFGKGQGFPLQNAFKQTEREPDPREGLI